MNNKLIIRKKEDQLILHLIKDEKDQVANFLINNTIDWKYVYTVLKKNKIKALISNILLSYNFKKSESLSKFIKFSLIEAELNKKIYLEELNKIKNLLNKNNIDFILLKGFSIDSSGLRDIGDLDLLINEKDLINTSRLLKQINYFYNEETQHIKITQKEKNDISLQLSWNTHFGFFNKNNKLLIELHTNLFQKKFIYVENQEKLLNSINSFWDNKVYNKNLDCFILCNEDILILLCLHLSIKRALQNNHFILRSVIDIKNFIENKKINWNLFCNRVISLQIVPFAFFSLLITQRFFQIHVQEQLEILKKKLKNNELFLTKIHLKCFYSLKSNSYFYSKLYRFLLPFILGKHLKDKIKAIFFIDILFPPRITMANIFNIPKNSPLIYLTYIINPFRWFYLIIKRIINKN